MNNLLDMHWYRLTHSVIVFGIAGLLFYVGLVLGSFAMKYSMQFLGFEKGLGL
jgi:hypothetical protein